MECCQVQRNSDYRTTDTLRHRECGCQSCVIEDSADPELEWVAIAVQGDNNWGDDRALYNKGQLWLHREHIMGRVVG
jgi:hypothetical protein